MCDHPAAVDHEDPRFRREITCHNRWCEVFAVWYEVGLAEPEADLGVNEVDVEVASVTALVCSSIGPQVAVRRTGPDRVRVRFESDTHTSDFHAEWQGGELNITTSETGDD